MSRRIDHSKHKHRNKPRTVAVDKDDDKSFDQFCEWQLNRLSCNSKAVYRHKFSEPPQVHKNKNKGVNITGKFNGDVSRIKRDIQSMGIEGEWHELSDNKLQFKSSCNASLSFWPKTGSINLQGSDRNISDFRAAHPIFFETLFPEN